MSITKAEQRQIENEMIFRRVNEKVGDDLGALDAKHIEEGNINLIRDADLLLRFKCECSDENCADRIPMQLSEYQRIHVDRDTFIVLPDHQVDPIEKIIDKTQSYSIVKKNNSTPEPNNTLKDTSTNNHQFSLIVIVKNREAHLKNVLYALQYATIQPKETIVVRMNEVARSLDFNGVKQIEIRDSHPLPLARARNAGAHEASSDTLIFLDVDCIPDTECFATLLHETGENTVSMVDPYYLSHKVEDFDMEAIATSAQPHPSRTELEYGRSDEYEMFWSLGFCVSKKTYQMFGGFDEAYIGYGGEDTDFAFTLREKKVSLNYSRARVYHQPHGSVDPPLNWLEDIVANAHVFKHKWHVWPMTGWLAAFQNRGYIVFDDTHIRLVRLPTEAEINDARVTQAFE